MYYKHYLNSRIYINITPYNKMTYDILGLFCNEITPFERIPIRGANK